MTAALAAKLAGQTAKWVGLSLLWTLQYTFVAPLLLAGKIVKLAAKMGFLGFLLLFIPIVGWIVLAYLVFRRAPEQSRERSIMRPWATRPRS